MDRVHRLLSSTLIVPADPIRLGEATAALLDEVMATLKPYGIEATLEEARGQWSISVPDVRSDAPEVWVNCTLGSAGLEGRREFPVQEDGARRITQGLLLARLTFDSVNHRLIAPDDPEGSALFASVAGILRALCLAHAAEDLAPEEAGAHLLLSRAFGGRGAHPGEVPALERLLDRAIGLLADHRVSVSRPAWGFARWTFSREPNPGTVWTVLVPRPTSARRIYGSISELRDGVASGPTRRLVLAELVYDPVADHLRPRRPADGSALEALLRGMLEALGWNTAEPDRGGPPMT